jgi:predicted transcriptional regulator
MNEEDENVLKISAKSFEEFKEDSLEKMADFEEGEDVPHSVSFEDPIKLRKVLTEKRIELIQFLIDNEVENIGELAESLNRGLKEVGKDLNILEEYNIVRIEREGRSKRPSVPYDRIAIDIGIEGKNQGKERSGKQVAEA